MWIWTTMRKVEYSHEAPDGMDPRVAMMTGIPLIHKYLSHEDHAALLNLDENCMFYEVRDDADRGVPDCIVFVPDIGREEVTMLADTLDDIARKVGAPRRPTVEVPAAFREG